MSLPSLFVVVPSHRPDGLLRLMNSLEETASDVSSFGVVVGHDADDLTTRSICLGFSFGIAVSLPSQERFNSAVAAWHMTRQHVADLNWVLNDDVDSVSVGWDSEIRKCPPGHLGLVVSNENDVVSFGVFGRRHIEEFGGIHPPEIWDVGADSGWLQLYRLAGRTFDLNVTVRHYRSPFDFVMSPPGFVSRANAALDRVSMVRRIHSLSVQ